MFVIVNIHKNYYEGKTYLSRCVDSGFRYCFVPDFKSAYIFNTREDAKREWNESISKLAAYKPSDSIMLEYINLQPDDFLQ